ncbi:hypothetical protein MMC07_000965 [Pseudocyphellaria aurata]|nr:hypothetical protein [Pseudocyphellaria aurata]
MTLVKTQCPTSPKLKDEDIAEALVKLRIEIRQAVPEMCATMFDNASVTLRLSMASRKWEKPHAFVYAGRDGTLSEFYEIEGVLLELADGFPLDELAERAPREHWREICDQAIGAIQLIGDLDILIGEDQPVNVIVASLPSENVFFWKASCPRTRATLRRRQ